MESFLRITEIASTRTAMVFLLFAPSGRAQPFRLPFKVDLLKLGDSLQQVPAA
jgi:hypothetical protein